MTLRYILSFAFLLLSACAGMKKSDGPLSADKPAYSIDELQRRHFLYFWELAYPNNYQIPDRYPAKDFSSVAATGFGLSAYIVGVERGWITRAQARERVLKTLEVLKNLPQGNQASGVSGYKGWYYHFLEIETALRFKNVELSSIDTTLLMAGILSCMSYFDGDDAAEKSIRDMADFLYRRVEWDWYMNEHNRLSMGWFPERDGFLCADWRGYNEAMLLNILALGSPTHPVPASTWDSWCKPYFRANFQGEDMVNFGPLFGHQYSHCWIDFKGIQDDYMRKMGIDYFENSRRATLAQWKYAKENPGQFKGYSDKIWGLTAGDGPDAEMTHNGKKIFCPGYGARGVAIDYLEDDGTIAPTAAISSLPFAPEICLPTMEAMWNRWPVGPYGFFDGYNETFTDVAHSPKAQPGYPYFVDKDYLGIDQGPMVIMIENYRSGLIWNLMKKNPYVIKGLKRAGFQGGWIEKTPEPDYAQPQPKPFNPEIPLDQHSFFRRDIYQDAAGNKLPYQQMDPWNAKTGEKYPLVVFLHGSGERGHRNYEQMRNGVHAFCEKEVREKHPSYLLVPQCPENERWGGASKNWPDLFDEKPTTPGRMTLELIDKMLKEHQDIDPKRVYIVGLSMGGFGTFDLMMRRPELFAAGVPVCGGGDVRFAEKIKNIPIWAIHGGLDDVVLPRNSRNIVDALKKINGNIKYTEYSTVYHNVWDIAFYDKDVMEWLFAQHR
jgi:predicted esterase